MSKEIVANEEVQKERIKLLYTSIIPAQTGMLLAAIILAYTLYSIISDTLILTWFFFFMVISVYRYNLYKSFKKATISNDFDYRKWEKRYLVGITLIALVWGVGGYIFYPKDHIVQLGVLEITLAGIGAISIGTLSPSLKAIGLFLPVLLLPFAFKALFVGSNAGVQLIAMILIYIALSLYMARRLNHNLIENLELRFKAKQNEQDIKESEEKYRLLYENSEDPMMVLTGNTFSMINSAAVKTFGYQSQQQILKVPPFDLSPDYQPDGIPSLKKAVKIMHLVSEKGSHQFEWTYKKRNGELHPADVTLTKIKTKGKTSFFFVMRDISVQKRAEQELLKAIKLAEEANSAKSDFLANMSHEIRTPMNGVVGYSNLLLKTKLNHQQRKRALAIQQSAKAMLVIINDILDYSKVEAGKLQLKPHDFNLTDLIQQLNSTVEPLINEKGLRFICFLDSAIHKWYFGDSIRLQQILLNLTNNAIKFTEHGKITVKCEEIEVVNQISTLRFAIKDTGIGIAKEQHSSMFNRFSQADSSTTRKYGGTGLGLSISKQLAQLMDGEIGFNSSENHGSEFWFTVKLKRINPPNEITHEDELPENVEKVQAKVLLVDDNITNQLVAKEILASFGLQVVIADDGKQAIEILKKEAIDIVFMDCQMPIMDGYQATEKIRNPETGTKDPLIPIIAITASAMSGDREKCIVCGMNDYITKPIEVEGLFEKIQKWLNYSKQEATFVNKTTLNIESPPQAKDSATDVIFDYKALSQRVSANHELIRKIARTFIQSTTQDIKNLEQMIKQEKFNETAKIAHKLKGSSITIGAMQLHVAAKELEFYAKSKNAERINKTYELMQECFDKTEKTLTTKLNL